MVQRVLDLAIQKMHQQETQAPIRKFLLSYKKDNLFISFCSKGKLTERAQAEVDFINMICDNEEMNTIYISECTYSFGTKALFISIFEGKELKEGQKCLKIASVFFIQED